MKVYLDYSATTPLDKAVFDEMLPYFCEFYGNADSVHGYGRDVAYAVDTARRRIANALSAKAGEIYFTSGGTEADNWALKGLAFANKNRGARIIVSAVEHAAVLAPAEWLRGQGFEIVYLPVEKNGVVAVRKKFLENEAELYAKLYACGVRVSSICPLMYTNNPLTKMQAIATNSNKLRTYSVARYYKDAEILSILSGEVKG